MTRPSSFLMAAGLAFAFWTSSATAQGDVNQSNSPAPPVTAASGEAAGAPVTDPEITAFALATVELHGLTDRSPEAMAGAITKHGMTVDRYNEISGAMQKDPAFQARVNTALQKAVQANPTTADAGVAAPSASPAASAPTSLPPLPTSGDGAVVVRVLDEVCLPMVRQDKPVSEVAPHLGMSRNRRDGSYALALGAKPFSVTVSPRGANQRVCSVEIHYTPGGGQPIASALNIWAARQQPMMSLQRNDAGVGADGLSRTTLSWEPVDRRRGLVFVRTDKADGTPLGRGYATATVLYSEQPS